MNELIIYSINTDLNKNHAKRSYKFVVSKPVCFLSGIFIEERKCDLL